MSDLKGSNSKASDKPATKKRTVYRPKGLLEMPKWALDDKQHKYRWVSKRRLARSDGFDPRGWVAAKDEQGAGLEAFDTILCRMPLEEYEAMREYNQDRAKNSIQLVAERMEDQQQRLRYEVEKLGGSITSDFSIERKQ